MLLKPLASCPEFRAGDHTRLREMLHPDRDPVALRYSLAHAELAPGEWSRLHRLATSEVYHILSGAGIMEIDGECRDTIPGDTIYIPPQARQRIFCPGPNPLRFLCIVDPAWREADEDVLE
jgi:mannose-6-phosphate isomerase-like protein (cupin superfamily)